MGVFRKLKDVLFDVEEDDDIIENESSKKEVLKEEKISESRKIENKKQTFKDEENTIKEIKIPREEIPERELIKSESTFNFPLDIEDTPKREKPRYDYNEPTKKRSMNDISRTMYDEKPKKEADKPFKPTPIISPVYGILDHNYSKDDIIVKTDVGVKGPDLDTVRKKAYGIDIKEDPAKEEKSSENIFRAKIEDTLPEEELSEIVDLIKEEETEEVIPEAEVNVEDTLETDLFKLIDSMYEEREEEE